MLDEAFPVSSRIRSSREFKRLSLKGKRLRQKHLGASALFLKKEEPSRIGIVVSKQVCKRAVDRNKLKRVIRECFRRERVKFKRSIEISIRVTSKPESNQQTRDELRNLFGQLF